MNRRQLLKGLFYSAAAAPLTISLSSCGDGDDSATSNTIGIDFTHGIASGDPLNNAVVIWTRAVPVAVGNDLSSIDVTWEVSEQADFMSITSSGTSKAEAANDYTVKVDVQGLQADTVYYYRFRNNLSQSMTGTTRTLPVDTNHVRLAVFSCANYPAGYFNVYREAAQRNDVDVVLHLGDYIYEYEKDGYASADAESLGRVSEPPHETITLDDYRKRYAQYRTDQNLIELHQKVPFILIWDDHEIADNTYKDGAANHDSVSEGEFDARVNVALQAWYEWLPVREPGDGNRKRAYRSFNFGSLLSLHILDTRLIGRDEPLDYDDYLDVMNNLDIDRFTAALKNTGRHLLGTEQLQWLDGALANSAATWQVLGQQVLMGRMELPAPIVLEQISAIEYLGLALLADNNPGALTADQQAILNAPNIPFNLGSWDGYFAERERVLNSAVTQDKNLIVLSGDSHNAWANDLQTMQGKQVGVEFATSSTSSPGLEESLPDLLPEVAAEGITQLVEPLRYANTAHRGYMVVDITADHADAEWVYVDTVKSTEYSVLESQGKKLRVLPGTENRQIIEV